MPARIRPDDTAQPTARVRRRAVLGVVGLGAVAGAVGVGTAGCGPFAGDRSGDGTPALAPVLAGALALVGGYQATLLAQPTLTDRLTPLLADHHAHVSALLTAMGRPASATPSATGSLTPSGVPADPTAALAQLRSAEQAAQTDATGACVAAPAGYAALLGSIAACRATHVEALT